MTLHRIDSHAELLDATGGSAFVRYDLPSPLDGVGFALGSAVAVPRRTHTRRLGLLVLGAPDAVDRLVGTMRDEHLMPDQVRSVTVQRGSLEAVAGHLPLADGNEWEWLCARSAPPVVAAEHRVVPLSRRHLEEIPRLLAVANPRTDARPFEFPDQRWVGVRDRRDRLVACGVCEPNVAGWPVLSGITVHPDERGAGLGLAVTAYLTREAVARRGVCTLGMYSDNDVARRLYAGLGYGDVHLWSSRRLAAGAQGA